MTVHITTTDPRPVVATFKVGTNKGRPRIWLDGKRLADAGFKGGTVYRCVVGGGKIICALDGVPLDVSGHVPGDPVRSRKVTGRADGKPIIDILGRDVEAAFGSPLPERVEVKFEAGRITIYRAE